MDCKRSVLTLPELSDASDHPIRHQSNSSLTFASCSVLSAPRIRPFYNFNLLDHSPLTDPIPNCPDNLLSPPILFHPPNDTSEITIHNSNPDINPRDYPMHVLRAIL